MSGRITIDGLSDSLKEYLNTLGLNESQVQQLIDKFEDEKIGDLSTLTTENKTVVAAINELFQSANNGKELIATAIGEPLTAEDTFSAMSSGINGLTANFKTALMNNGVSVEGSDKFKQLIEKLSLLADSEGKGIQYASGTILTSTGIKYVKTQGTDSYTSNSGYLAEVTTLSFKPMIVLLANSNNEPAVAAYNTDCFINLENIYHNIEIATLTSSVVGNGITNLKLLDNGFKLATYKSGSYTYHAIGVGEEDTTLLDSLKSILEDESVEVTDEDTMADLIVKVDNEFDNKNNEIASMVIPAGDAVSSDVSSGKTFINSTGQLITGTGTTYLCVFENGGDESKYTVVTQTANSGKATLTHNDGYLNMYTYGSSYQTGKIYFTINEEFDLTDKTMVLFDLSISGNANYVYYKFGVYEGTDNFTSSTTLVSYIADDSSNTNPITKLRAKYVVDVSSCTGIHKIGIYFATYGTYAGNLNLYNIEIK